MAHPPNKQARHPDDRPPESFDEPWHSSEEHGTRPPLVQPDLEAHAFIPPRLEPEAGGYESEEPIGDRKDIR